MASVYASKCLLLSNDYIRKISTVHKTNVWMPYFSDCWLHLSANRQWCFLAQSVQCTMYNLRRTCSCVICVLCAVSIVCVCCVCTMCARARFLNHFICSDKQIAWCTGHGMKISTIEQDKWKQHRREQRTNISARGWQRDAAERYNAFFVVVASK